MKMILRMVSLGCMALLMSLNAAHASLLWKVSGNGLQQPSYVYGTIHLICKEQFYMDERIEQALAESEQLAKEIDISSPQTMMRVQQLMVNPDGPYLENHLSEDELAQLDQYFLNNFGAGLAQLGGLKPMALNSMLLVGAMPCSETESYEAYFAEQAKLQELPIVELETVDFQMSLFDDIPEAEQVRWLVEMVQDEDATEAQMEGLVTAYLNEDLDALLELMNEDPQFAEYSEALLDARNRNWIDPLEEMMQARSTFVAVGAGHLPGDMGVIELLRRAGYQVEAVQRP